MKVEEVVGRRIREAREARGLSQEEFGGLLATHLAKPWARQAMSAAEKGQRSFSAVELLAISVVIGCDIAALFRMPGDLDGVTMPSGVRLSRDQISPTADSIPSSIEALRLSLGRMVREAETLRVSSTDTERRARQAMDDLDGMLPLAGQV